MDGNELISLCVKHLRLLYSGWLRTYTDTIILGYLLIEYICVCLGGYFSSTLAVQVDEEPKRETTLPNDLPVNLQRIFLGGIPPEVEQTSNRANIPFQGCIWNLMINTMYVTLSLRRWNG